MLPKTVLNLLLLPQKCVNCGGDHPANFTGCPRYQQHLLYAQNGHQVQQQTHKQKLIPPYTHRPLANSPPLRTPSPPSHPPQTWAQITAQTPDSSNTQSLSSTIDSIKSILTMFDFHKLSTLLRSLTLQLQESNDPITKIVAIVDTVLACLSSSL